MGHYLYISVLIFTPLLREGRVMCPSGSPEGTTGRGSRGVPFWNDISCGRRGRMGSVAPAVPSRISEVPSHCWKKGVLPTLFCCFLGVVSYSQMEETTKAYVSNIYRVFVC